MRGHTLCSGVNNDGLLQPKGLKQIVIREGLSINKLHVCAFVCVYVCVCNQNVSGLFYDTTVVSMNDYHSHTWRAV